jgi:hypothetical protein
LVKSNTTYSSLHARDANYIKENKSSNKDVSFFPNPAINEINIKSSSSEYNIEIVDLFGNLVITRVNPQSISLHGLTSGVYTLIYISDNFKHTFKLVIL